MEVKQEITIDNVIVEEVGTIGSELKFYTEKDGNKHTLFLVKCKKGIGKVNISVSSSHNFGYITDMSVEDTSIGTEKEEIEFSEIINTPALIKDTREGISRYLDIPIEEVHLSEYQQETIIEKMFDAQTLEIEIISEQIKQQNQRD